MTTGPAKVPVTPFDAGAGAGACVVLVAAGVGVAVAEAVADAEELAVAAAVAFVVADLVAVAFLVVTGFDVALFDGAAAVVLVAAGVDDAEAVEPPIAPIPAPMPAVSEVVNCGGVIAMTAPSPPKVPPAINSARFIFNYLSSLLLIDLIPVLNCTNLRDSLTKSHTPLRIYSRWKAKASSWKRFFGPPTSSNAWRTALTKGSGPQIYTSLSANCGTNRVKDRASIGWFFREPTK